MAKKSRGGKGKAEVFRTRPLVLPLYFSREEMDDLERRCEREGGITKSAYIRRLLAITRDIDPRLASRA